jgi:hypothetical protein
MKINPTYSSGDINFIHDEAQIFVESIINNLDDNITPILGDDGNYHYVYLTVNKTNGFFYIGKKTVKELNSKRKFKSHSVEVQLQYLLKMYYGSGRNIQKAIETEGKSNFLKFVIKFCKSSKEGFDLENRLVDEETLKQFFNLQCMYNIQTGGIRHKIPLIVNKRVGKARELSIYLIKNENTFKVKPSEVLKYLLDGYVPKSYFIKLYKIENQRMKEKQIRLKKCGTNSLNSISDLIHALQNGWIFGHPKTLRAKQHLANQSIEQPQLVQPPQPLQPPQPVQAPQPLQPIKQGRPRKPTFQFEASLFDWQDKII